MLHAFSPPIAHSFRHDYEDQLGWIAIILITLAFFAGSLVALSVIRDNQADRERAADRARRGCQHVVVYPSTAQVRASKERNGAGPIFTTVQGLALRDGYICETGVGADGQGGGLIEYAD